MKTQVETASEKFLSGYNCAQSILFAFGPDLGMAGETALKVATGLGAGLARRGETCGAVTGGILALGLKFGRGANQDRSATEETYRKTAQLMSAFEQRLRSCSCRVLLQGCDLRTDAGQQQFKQQDLLHKTCVHCVQDVASILSGMLDAPASQSPAMNKR